MAFVEDYTDEQLQIELRGFGFNLPITPTSRRVCENKLKKLLAEANGTPQQTVLRSDSPQDFADNSEPLFSTQNDRESTPLSADSNIHRRNLPSTQRQQKFKRQATDEQSENEHDGETSARELSHHERQIYKVRQGTNVWKYIGIFILVSIVIAFLVFLNRNAQHITDDEI